LTRRGNGGVGYLEEIAKAKKAKDAVKWVKFEMPMKKYTEFMDRCKALELTMGEAIVHLIDRELVPADAVEPKKKTLSQSGQVYADIMAMLEYMEKVDRDVAPAEIEFAMGWDNHKANNRFFAALKGEFPIKRVSRGKYRFVKKGE
jgi:hypothetical protein